MGVDTKIRLPDWATIEDVADCIGILAGLPPKKNDIGGGFSSVKVEGVSIKTTCVVQMAQIEIQGDLIDGEKLHHCYYHFEYEQGGRLLMPRSTPFWIAVGRGLVKFFGGSICYMDCNGNTNMRVKPRLKRTPSDGKPWQEWQDAIYYLKPLTKAEIESCRKWAAYQ